jgi:hypothetical protein
MTLKVINYKWLLLLLIPVLVHYHTKPSRHLTWLDLSPDNSFQVVSMETLHGYFPASLEYQPYKMKLDYHTSRMKFLSEKMDSLFNARHIPSTYKSKSTYFRYRELDDSFKIHRIKAEKVIEEVKLRGREYNTNKVLGYVQTIAVFIVQEDDTTFSHNHYIWLDSTFDSSPRLFLD